MPERKVEPQQPPYWAWFEAPDTGQGIVYDTTGAAIALCASGTIARRIAFSVNTVGLVELPAAPEEAR